MEIVAGRKKKEKTVKLRTIGLGKIFRLPGNSFERCIESDDGPDFYQPLSTTKDGLIEVVTVDFKGRRKLPEETEVVPHNSKLKIYPNK